MNETVNRHDSDIAIGDRVCFTCRFSDEILQNFSRLGGDGVFLFPILGGTAPLQRNTMPVHFISLPLSAIAGMMLPGYRFLDVDCHIHAVHPAFYDQEVTYSARVVGKDDLSRTIMLRTIAFHQTRLFFTAQHAFRVMEELPRAWAPHGGQDRFIPRTSGVRTVLITGVRGGIGSAMALYLAGKGFNLVVTSRPEPNIADEAIIQRCREYGITVEWIAADLGGGTEGWMSLVERIAHGGDITDLIHVASPPVHASACELLHVNYVALKTLSEALLPHILARQEGQILMLGSSAVQSIPEGWEDYTAAKAAASHYIAGLNDRFGTCGFIGWVLAPGRVNTGFIKEWHHPDTPSLQPEQIAEAAYALLCGQHGTDGGYLWLEPQIPERLGRFGFYDSEMRASLEPDRSARSSPSVGTVQETDIDGLFRQFFKLTSSDNIASARVGESLYWDSLRHIEFMLFLEKNMGLTFSSKDIDRTKRYLDLVSLIAEKRKSES
ncbi:MAG: SDR family NAD(P)-dependent oxidoreductase [Nitrospirae bacterium]|nr:SDR family NAD(P)-dependent oxidoreductase [Magnetococcales bacterium]HAT50287.1 hypothetical protein [Alphaproteobacteria bacterium]